MGGQCVGAGCVGAGCVGGALLDTACMGASVYFSTLAAITMRMASLVPS